MLSVDNTVTENENTGYRLFLYQYGLFILFNAHKAVCYSVIFASGGLDSPDN